MGFSSGLKKSAIRAEQTYKLTLTRMLPLAGCEQPPTLTLRHGGDENPAWRSARAKATAELKAIGGSTDADAELARLKVNARLVARAGCVEAWLDVCEDDAPGKPVPCTLDKAEELLVGMAEHCPDELARVIGTVLDPTLFRLAQAVDVAALGKP